MVKSCFCQLIYFNFCPIVCRVTSLGWALTNFARDLQWMFQSFGQPWNVIKITTSFKICIGHFDGTYTCMVAWQILRGARHLCLMFVTRFQMWWTQVRAAGHAVTNVTDTMWAASGAVHNELIAAKRRDRIKKTSTEAGAVTVECNTTRNACDVKKASAATTEPGREVAAAVDQSRGAEAVLRIATLSHHIARNLQKVT